MKAKNALFLLIVFIAVCVFSSLQYASTAHAAFNVKFEATGDTNPPTWSSVGTNGTLAGQPTRFYANWSDDVGLSGFIFGTNNTGAWANDTWVSFVGTTNWSNVTKILDNEGGKVIQWQVWANDTSSNWNSTGILSLTTQTLPVAAFSYSPSTPYTSQTVTFNASTSNDPDGTISSYLWTLGDGTNTTGVVASHAYIENGVYNVTLTITDNDGLTSNQTQSITVLNRDPVAAFTQSAMTAPTGTIIYFNGTNSYDSDGFIASYFWIFGDGTNATGAIVNHAYTDNGTYTLTLKVTDNDGAMATSNSTITIYNRQPVASFTSDATTVSTGTAVNFTASGSYDPDGSIVSYFWSFSDGTNATGVTTSHTYGENGVYTVTLMVTDNDGATSTATSTITVLNRSPVASFTKSATSALTKESVTFNASESYDADGWITAYTWDFGDGNITAVVVPVVTHLYADNGTYTVTLTVTDNDGATNSSSAAITVLNRAPVAVFNQSATTIYTDQAVTFNASTSYDLDGWITVYTWDFGDGNITTIPTPIITHMYQAKGMLTVILTVIDNDGVSNSSSSTVTVLNRPPIASFTQSATTVFTGELVYFNASSSNDLDGTITTYFWAFGDGTNATGIAVSHAYVENAIYTVTLRVIDNDGASGTTSTTETVQNRLPVASFTESASTVLTGQTIYFNASASHDPDGSMVSYFWAFGDGANASGISSSHAYVDNGVYTVTLTVTDNDGATALATAVKTVLNIPPVAAFTESAEFVYVGETITFNASQSYDQDGFIANYFWTFGDGSNATGIIVTHAYAVKGSFTVILVVTDNDGATATASAVKTVGNKPPIASFTQSASTALTNEIIYVDASTSSDSDGFITSYFWELGDATNATGATSSHSYSENGVYAVKLTVTDNDGSMSSITSTVSILNRPPTAFFTQSASTVLTGEIIHFNASACYDSDGFIVSYSWTFGDGATATGMTPSYSYVDDGVYTVTLTVMDNDGAATSATATLTVLNRSPVASFTQSTATTLTHETIQFNASSSSDPDGWITSYFWTFGDGTNTSGVISSHSYADNGMYTVALTITDNDGLKTTASSVITVLNRPPVATFASSATQVLTGEVIIFNATSSYDPDGFIITYFWTFGDSFEATGEIAQHSYATKGVYNVLLTLTDNDGAIATATTIINVQNQLPIASYTYSPGNPIANQAVMFNASGSHDPDGVITSYTWDFGDGNLTTVTAPLITHTYSVFGNYTVTLTVSDNGQDTAINTQTIRIRDYPTADFSYSPSSPIVGQSVTFNASLSTPRGGTIASYVWNFGDGTSQFSTTDPITTHAYLAFGNYTVTLTVLDTEELSATTSTAVRIRDYPSAAFSFSPSYPIEKETVTFDASSSAANGGVITSYQWSFGDGNITTVVTPMIVHAYSAIGNYTITLTVTDSESLTNTLSKIAGVRGYPVASFTFEPSAPYVGDTVIFNASLSSPNGGVIVKYQWSYGDTTPLFNATNPIATNIYSKAGNYSVILTVTDSEGLSATGVHLAMIAQAPIASFTSSPVFPSVGQLITFNALASYDPNGYIVSYRWDFADGNVTTTPNPIITHAYSITGVYSVSLTVMDNGGFTDIKVGFVTLGTPKAAFTFTPRYPIVGQSITFNASNSYDPNGYVVSYIWNFGDNNVTTATNPIMKHSYASKGNYTATLTVSDNDGLTDTTSLIVPVGNAPIASFTWSPIPTYMGDIVTFNGSASSPSSGSITNYLWNFGDGSPIQNNTVPTTTHTYTAAGNYTVSLTIKDTAGLSNTITKTVRIMQSPVAIFTYSPTYPQAFDTVTFSASSSYDANGHIVSYVWNFGDGNVTAITNPTTLHVYKTAGNYTVVLIVADNQGYTHTATQSVYVSVRPPAADFMAKPDFPLVRQSVTFNASGSYDLDGNIVSYTWNFGDGNITTVASSIVLHQYLIAENYTVTLTVTDNDNLTNARATIVRVRDYPSASFSYTPTVPNVGSPVTFNATSSVPNGGVIVSYLWDFGDGSATMNTTNPIISHVFSAFGDYTVTLTAYDSEGLSNTKFKIIYVAQFPVASFDFSPSTPYVGDTVTFNASTSYDPDGYIVSYLWDFGDGSPPTTSNTPITTHVFSAGGNYVSTLAVTDAQGLTSTTTSILSVGKAPMAVFTVSPSFPIVGESVTFDASASYDARRLIAAYTWNFGDGNIMAVTNPIVTHTYAIEGSYTVLLTVTDIGGYADTTTRTLGVRNYPVASFTYSPSYPIKGQDVTLDASYSQPRGGIIVSYLWDFGDGTTSITSSPILKHAYRAIGQFNVTLTVADSEGLTATTFQVLKVRDYPTTDFTWYPSYPTATQSVTFNASSSKANSGIITGYMLELGDGTIKTGANPIITYVYTQAKNYTVKLTVTNSEGLSSSVSKIITVLDAPPIASFKYNPLAPLTGQIAVFNASDSHDPDGSIASYRWDFGDGNITTATTPVIYHMYTTARGFTVTLTITDNAGLTATASQTVRVITYPTASFTWSPQIPGSTEPIAFDATASTANSGFIVSYTWNFGDGNTTTAATALIVHQYGIKGSYAVTLTVANSENLSSSQSQTITVTGTPPIANFTWQPALPQIGETVAFDGSSCLARGGIVTNYRWDFGDGSTYTSISPKTTHRFTGYGQYNVTLTVSDSEGLSDTASKMILVVAAPVASFTWSPQFPKAYEIVTFNASASTPNGGAIIGYTWNFGDGNITTASNPTIIHTYTSSGNYSVNLRVTDDEGLSGTMSNRVFVSAALSPQADFIYSPQSPYVFEIVAFNASSSIQGTGSIINYEWNFGDGNITSVTSPLIVHTYMTSRNVTVALTVTNTAGIVNTKSKQIAVLPISGPNAEFTWSPLVPQPNKTVTFDASGSTAGWNGSIRPPIAIWLWDFGDGNITQVAESTITHIYSVSGDQLVTLTVIDINGLTDRRTKTIKVTNLLGDINGDGKVDIKDVAIVAKAYGSYPGYPNWNPEADLNGDGKVDIKDVAIVAKQYGKTLTSMTLLISPTRTPSYSLFQYWVAVMTSLLASAFILTIGIGGKRKRRLSWHPGKNAGFTKICFRINR